MLVTATIDQPHAELMRRFCSLGDNCELGVAQRRLGAEPADLLRWAAIDVPSLLRLLAARGCDLTDSGQLRLSVVGAYHWVRHDGYRYGWHSLLRVGVMPEADVVRREVQRMPKLAENLFAELGEGSRIFVLKRSKVAITPAEAGAVLEAMGEYGEATLFYVTPSEAGRPGGTIELVAPRLVHGYLDRFADDEQVVNDTPVELWLQLCRSAADLVDAAAD